MNKCCIDCKWWDKEAEDRKKSLCRRNAPKPNIKGFDATDSHWPWTFDEDWCGEFKSRNSQNDNFFISRLDLSTRAQNCLELSGIKTIGELRQRSRSDLLDIRNFGNTCLREVKRKLADMGVVLSNDDSL